MPASMEKELCRITNLMARGTWYSSGELQQLWKVTPQRRKGLVQHLTRRGMIKTRGKTAQIRYKLWNSEPSPAIKETLKNKTTVLDDLINAAAKMGEENEVAKQALRDIDAILGKVREFL